MVVMRDCVAHIQAGFINSFWWFSLVLRGEVFYPEAIMVFYFQVLLFLIYGFFSSQFRQPVSFLYIRYYSRILLIFMVTGMFFQIFMLADIWSGILFSVFSQGYFPCQDLQRFWRFLIVADHWYGVCGTFLYSFSCLNMRLFWE